MISYIEFYIMLIVAEAIAIALLLSLIVNERFFQQFKYFKGITCFVIGNDNIVRVVKPQKLSSDMIKLDKFGIFSVYPSTLYRLRVKGKDIGDAFFLYAPLASTLDIETVAHANVSEEEARAIPLRFERIKQYLTTAVSPITMDLIRVRLERDILSRKLKLGPILAVVVIAVIMFILIMFFGVQR